MITAGTYRKAHLLNSRVKLDMVHRLLLEGMSEAGWRLHAWAILSNHYHVIASSPTNPETLRHVTSKLHTLSAKELNRLDGQRGRKVWFQYFDSQITFTNSYLPRLKYVHQNPVHHGVIDRAEDYPWCSAGWFVRTAPAAFRKTVESFRTDSLSVYDRFDTEGVTVPDTESGVKPPHSKGVSPISPPHGPKPEAGEMQAETP